ncbi:glycosyltransferase family 2 protein [Paenibacillus sp. UNC499MF]|uniref:glycosyltransferase n=1 Tax=Paenibacillus sp. UNC499MF TaxID=1502751 RepID=UPI00089F9A9F|nr:glycosyltransferase family 2 protein [Paenibacillus sp. UNC499MF]SEG05625.1 Glycosyltransferase, catalytic subunit of cellulose synthase and poly-beta-1,6-N-acetylglucosamine synthase [Paenibacillus sp. UNC499MF]
MIVSLIGSVTLFFTLWLLWNIRQWPKVRTGVPGVFPRVSILVPARNEERGIVRCVESLAAQNYPDFEILVLDDRSEDRTPALLGGLARRHRQVRVLHGRKLPEGWVGKVHACHQLYEASSGSWLLFVDADTVHTPDMLRSVLHTAFTRETSFVTGFPRVLSAHAFGWLILPMLHFIIALHLPVRFVSRSRDDRFMAAHGAFMLFSREAYEKIGGHAAFKTEMVEDMALARAVKRAGFQADLLDITPVTSCEMYETPRDVVEGFTKNIFLGVGRSSAALFALLFLYGSLYVWPLLGAVFAFAGGNLYEGGFWTGIYLLGVLQKWTVDHRFGTKGPWHWFLPLSFAGLGYIALRSWYIGITKRGYSWKGRVYR